jgi:ribosomal protein S18 acetylase RimI-like enzyme
MPVRIEPLGDHHDRANFSCGIPALDDWFRNRAGQDERRNVSRVFVAVDDRFGLVGYYTLSSFSIAPDELPHDLSRKLPRYGAIPAVLIGRLARNQRARGGHLGEMLLTDAIRRVGGAARSVAVYAIVVDAKDERAAEFYRSYGFQPFPLRPQRLFLTTATAIAALKG